MARASAAKQLDHTSDERFRAYYEEKSATAQARAHFVRIREKVLALLARQGQAVEGLRVLDIGCNAGTQALLWAEAGHRVRGLDVNEPLLQVARGRALVAGLVVEFDLGTATQLPYADGTVDVCLMLELLEHVPDWESCVNEAVRVLAPGGVLYLSTTNALCPLQQEFNLPLYSWYPAPLKRHFERLSVTTQPQLVNYTRYPAVHWFTFNGLRRHLGPRAMRCFDRFDLIDTTGMGRWSRVSLWALRRIGVLRWLGHMLTAGTTVTAIKHKPGVRPLKRPLA